MAIQPFFVFAGGFAVSGCLRRKLRRALLLGRLPGGVHAERGNRSRPRSVSFGGSLCRLEHHLDAAEAHVRRAHELLLALHAAAADVAPVRGCQVDEPPCAVAPEDFCVRVGDALVLQRHVVVRTPADVRERREYLELVPFIGPSLMTSSVASGFRTAAAVTGSALAMRRRERRRAGGGAAGRAVGAFGRRTRCRHDRVLEVHDLHVDQRHPLEGAKAEAAGRDERWRLERRRRGYARRRYDSRCRARQRSFAISA